jgi:hypothetical protein
MDRNLHKRHIPYCPTQVALPNQYSWPEKDGSTRLCHNGLSAPIYQCNGEIHYSLPLHQYPGVSQIHPEVLASKSTGYENRAPRMNNTTYPSNLPQFKYNNDGLTIFDWGRTQSAYDMQNGRTEGFYVNEQRN